MIPTVQVGFFCTFTVCLLGLGWFLPILSRRFLFFAQVALACFAALLAVPQLHSVASLLLGIGVSARVTTWSSHHARATRRLIGGSLPVIVAVFLVLVATPFVKNAYIERQAIANRPPPLSGAPNLILITLDTVRADAMSLYGYPRETTPNLADLARFGVRFDRAIVCAPWTLPSHASMFTGRSASELALGPDKPLDNRFETLAEHLRSRGYSTGGFVGNTVFCAAPYGLDRGFEHYEDFPLSVPELLRSSGLGWLFCKATRNVLDAWCQLRGCPPRHPFEVDYHRKDAARLNRDALRWIDQQGGQPFFVFMNYYDAHDPYLTPVGEDHHFGRPPRTLADYKTLRQWIGFESNGRAPEQVALARDAYDNCLAYLDSRIGQLFVELERRGLIENTLIVVTSDHGEHFGEHRLRGKDLFGHGESLYQAEIRVPLILFWPGRIPPGVVVGQPASLRNLAPTIVDLLGLHDGSKFPGQSLADSFRTPTSWDEDSLDAPCTLSEFVPLSEGTAITRYRGNQGTFMRTLLRGEFAYHHHNDNAEELYNLTIDPQEQNDLSKLPECEPELVRFRALLNQFTPGRPTEPPPRRPIPYGGKAGG